ncbi:prophage protein [Candidatus Termititenax aidoneus]|uniref:Prophage protein n=1 Tax=Termititenax aidoneus TaxID=2218524 RepID=A0A388TAZ8_TERA1|nr:prophage protein [Candidatus Termititenax aidoneus]
MATSQTKITDDIRELEKKVKKWVEKITALNQHQVRLGVFGGNAEDGTSLPMIGAVHEFGSKKRSVPERSFLGTPLKSHKQEITESVAINVLNRLEKDDVEGVYDDIGNAALNVVHNAFATEGDGAWPKRKKKSDGHPLLHDTGVLENSIRYEVTGGQK